MATLINTITVKGISSLAETTDYTMPTQSVAGQAEEFEAVVNAADGRWFIELDNSNGSSDVTASFLAGDYVGAKNAELGTVKADGKALIFADSACFKTGGKLRFKLTPASGAALATCGIKLHAVQFLPTECK